MWNHIIARDIDIFIFINSQYSSAFDWVFWFVTQIGNFWVVFPLLYGVILIKTPYQILGRVVLVAFLAVAISSAVTSSLKYLVNRPRPELHFQKYPDLPRRIESAPKQFPSEELFDSLTIELAGPQLRRQSFPSNHAALTFSAATVLIYFFGGGWFCLGLAVAAIVSYSRIYLGVHFPLDTIAGALTGVAPTWVTLKLTIGRIKESHKIGSNS